MPHEKNTHCLLESLLGYTKRALSFTCKASCLGEHELGTACAMRELVASSCRIFAYMLEYFL